MYDAYSMADNNNIIPVKALEQKILDDQELGIVWPNGLFSIIDDLNHRQIRNLTFS